MGIHILDYVMWFVMITITWNLIDYIWNGEFTNELGGLIGVLILAFVTLIYVVLFGVIDYNWIDIFSSVHNFIKTEVNVTF